MTEFPEPSCRLVARLYNARHRAKDLLDAPPVLRTEQAMRERAEDVRRLLVRARRAVAREAGLTVPTGFEPTPAGANAAVTMAALALDEVIRRYGERFD